MLPVLIGAVIPPILLVKYMSGVKRYSRNSLWTLSSALSMKGRRRNRQKPDSV